MPDNRSSPCARRDFPAVRRHMRASRTIGAVKSYFSKNRRRLDLDRLAEEGARSGALAAAPEQLPQLLPDGHAQVRCPPALDSLSRPLCTRLCCAEPRRHSAGLAGCACMTALPDVLAPVRARHQTQSDASRPVAQAHEIH